MKATTSFRAMRLAALEWAFVGAVILLSAVLAVVLGKETGWDFRNYHWYDAYAFLGGRMGLDAAVAHHATYYNPLLDLPFYWLATRAGTMAALAFLGAAQGLNIFPLYVMSRALLAPAWRGWAVLLALVGFTGSTALCLAGTTSYDAILSVLVLTSLAVLVAKRERLSARAIVGAGFLMGAAVGLKLVEAPFAVGFAAALLVMPGGRASRLMLGALGGIVGFALFGGFWFALLYGETGNPLFPYFNDVFGAPLGLDASYRDTRFVPDSFWHALVYPFRFSFDWALADDTPFQNLRVLAAYIAVPLAFLLRAVWKDEEENEDEYESESESESDDKNEPLVLPDAAFILFAFAAASYVAWLAVFGIYRYIVALEMLAPLLIVAAIGLIPILPRTRQIAIALVLAATAIMARYDFGARAGQSDPYVQVQMNPIAQPEHAMILMTGVEPMGFIVPSLPPEIPVLRIDGWLASPRDGSALTAEMKRRVLFHPGDLFLLMSPHEPARARAAIADYGLAIAQAGCRNVTTNLGGPYLFCPLVREPRPHA